MTAVVLTGRRQPSVVALEGAVRLLSLVFPGWLALAWTPSAWRRAVLAMLAVAMTAIILTSYRELARRLRLTHQGQLSVDTLLTRRKVDLRRLQQVVLQPDRPYFTDPRGLPRLAGPFSLTWQAPQVLLADDRGGEVVLPLSDYWGPPAPIFTQVLAAAQAAAAVVSDTAAAELGHVADQAS